MDRRDDDSIAKHADPLRSTVVAVQVGTVLMLLWALVPTNPYGYYLLLRVVVCSASAFLAVRAANQKRTGWVWLLGTVALVYNPVFRVHLAAREIWVVVNVLTAVLLAATIPVLGVSRPRNA